MADRSIVEQAREVRQTQIQATQASHAVGAAVGALALAAHYNRSAARALAREAVRTRSEPRQVAVRPPPPAPTEDTFDDEPTRPMRRLPK